MQHELQSGESRARLRPGELLAVVAFWAFLAILSAVGRLIDPRGPEVSAELGRRLVALSFIEYTLWAALTVPIVVLVTRIVNRRQSAFAKAMSLIVLGLLVAIAIDSVLRFFRISLLPPPPGRPPYVFSAWNNLLRFEFLDDFMVFVALLGAALARDYFFRYQARVDETQRLHAQLAEAQLTALRGQLNPHFLFNTLNAVATLVDSDPRGVRRMIARLSELLRHTLDESQQQEVPLSDEMKLLRRYLDIMEVRFQGRLDISLAIQPGLEDALVPNMILQPLVENAFEHGVGGMERGAKVEVRARHDGDEIILTVRDNGTGPVGAAQGIGLSNTAARLAQLYGTAQRLELKPAGVDIPGAIVEVRLPYHTTPMPAVLP